MNDTKREIEEWFKEFREHNIDATISCDIRQDIRVLNIDTSKHDAKVRADAIDDVKQWLYLNKHANYETMIAFLDQLEAAKG